MKTNKISLLVTFLIASIQFAFSQGKELFDNTYLHEIRFNSNNSNLWYDLSKNFYTMVNMTADGNVVDSVGLRLKGGISYETPQRPLKIDVNRYVSGKKYDGLIKFNLHNNYEDTFMQRDGLAYELYRKAGLPSPRTAYAEVYVNNDFKGVYSITEQVDKTFLKYNFPSNDGSLYKGINSGQVGEITVKEGTIEEYNNYINNVNPNNIQDYVNLRNYLKLLAVDVLIEDWDSYAYERHNYYIYYESKSERLNFIPWDHSYAFDLEGYANDTLYPLADTGIINDPDIKQMYQQTMCELLSYLIDNTYITGLATHNYNIIQSNTNGVIADDPAPLIQYIADRKVWLENELANEGVTCEDLEFPLDAGDIVVNEFVAWSDSINGVQEPDGGTPDWIELYNNTGSAITLNEYYYLSDDKNFPKKWYFPEAVTIEAGGYLIIWADKDVHQQGIHAGFKLEKNGGDLLMTYENITEIQNINFGGQELNQGYARVPNGTGSFVIQQHTFNGNNNDVSIIELEDTELMVYPNPVSDVLNIRTSGDISTYQLTITNSMGQTVHSSKGEKEIDMEHLTPGLYILTIENSNAYKTIKLIKQ